MSSAFVCGYMPEETREDISLVKIAKILSNYIEEKDIDTIYITKRTDFDYQIFVAIVSECKRNVNIIEVIDKYSMDTEYKTRIGSGVTFKSFCPSDTRIDRKILFRTLYDYAIENSEHMITYSRYDDDISYLIMEKAAEKGLEILNFADYFHPLFLTSTFETNIIE